MKRIFNGCLCLGVCAVAGAMAIRGSAATKAGPNAEPPRLEAFMFPAKTPETYAIQVRLYPNAGRAFTVPPDGVTVRVADEREEPAPIGFERVPPPVTLRDGPSDYKDPDTVAVGLKMARNGTPSGMYHMRADVRARVTDAATGAEVASPTTTAAMDLYLPPVPDRAPSLAPGRKFLYVPRDAPVRAGKAAPALRDAHGKPLPRKSVVLRVLQLERIEREAGGRPPILWFRLDGIPGGVQLAWPGEDATALPNLYALVEDNDLRALRKLFEGHRVWGLGGLGAECVTENPRWGGGFGTNGQKPFTVKALYRIAKAGVTMTLGNQVGAIGGDTTSYFTSNPLLAVLDVPKGVESTGSMWSGDVPEAAASDPTRLCIGFYRMFGGGWEMKREYSLLPLEKAHPEWPKAMRRAVKAGELKKGMTPEMVLWTIGWPPIFGTAADLRKHDAWAYDNVRPFHYWVHFKDGRVTDFGPDGTLP